MGLFGKNKDKGEEDLALGISLLETNEEAALQALHRACDKGNAEAQYRMGSYYEDTNPGLALGYYEDSYDNGCQRAGFRLARMNILDKNGDEEIAISILADAFESGDDSLFEGSLDAMYDMGVSLFYGNGCLADAAIGTELLERGADLGHVPSLAFLKERGIR
ncbi:MAG: hypothetical protein WCR17_02280 [Candidatus Methanomethylophilaceae archaeon]|jgi:TPR repeat protein